MAACVLGNRVEIWGWREHMNVTEASKPGKATKQIANPHFWRNMHSCSSADRIDLQA